MVKAKDFWQFTCVDLGCKLFTGCPCKEFENLYVTMDSGIMHYVPATSAKVALGMVCGYWFTGQRGVVLLPSDELFEILPQLETFVSKNKIPVLVVVPKIVNTVSDRILVRGPKDTLRAFVNRLSSDLRPAILEIGRISNA